MRPGSPFLACELAERETGNQIENREFLPLGIQALPRDAISTRQFRDCRPLTRNCEGRWNVLWPEFRWRQFLLPSLPGQGCKPSVACRVTAVLSPDRELRLPSQFAYAAECLLARCDSDPALIGTRASRNFSAMVTRVKNGLNARLVSSLESTVFAVS